MRLDLTPLYRSTVGFDRMFRLLDAMPSGDAAQSYPPYNIERLSENAYRVSMAVAGFAEDDLTIEVKEGTLAIRGDRQGEDKDAEVLFRGIASRGFERRFHLADHVEVKGATLKNGLLHVELVREIPEAMKPRTIAINGGTASQPKAIEDGAIEGEAVEVSKAA